LNGIGRETVRTQIKSIFHKTGTQRQGELVRLLSSLPAQTVQ
jgi:DNA-binding CsgD family transcriptional regulator